MAYYSKKNKNHTTVPNLSNLARGSEISSYVKKEIFASQYDFHDMESLEVESVILNEKGKRGYVSGVLLNSGDKKQDVKPLFGNLTTIPLKYEHVLTIELEGQLYYTTIINRKGLTNENSAPSVSDTYTKKSKLGNNFQRKKVKPIEIGEGCITFEGRFGQTLHFDGHDNTPKIKISTHVDESDGDFRKENIDNDDSSIYLTSRGMRDRFDGEQIEGKKVLIQSDGIFIKGRQEVKINAPNLSVIKDEVKLGSKDATQAVVLGDELKKILEDIASVLKLLPVAIDNTQSPLSAKDPLMVKKISGLTFKINNMLSKKVKTI